VSGFLQHGAPSQRSRNEDSGGGVIERKLKVDFLGETEKIYLPKNGTDDRFAYQVSGHFVSSMEDRKSITDNRRSPT